MRTILVFILVLALALLLQTAIISRITLLSGQADLFLVILAALGLQERFRFAWVWALGFGYISGNISGAHWSVYLVSYLLVVGMARLLTRRVWQAPLLASFAVTFTGTLILMLLTYTSRVLIDSVSLPFGDAFFQIILPMCLLNLLLVIPIHPLMRDVAGWIYPGEVAT